MDSAGLHQDDAVDLGNDVGDVVGDEEDSSSLAGEGAEEFAEVLLGGQVEGVGGFVEKEHAGGSYEGAADHDAALFAGRHLAYGLVAEVGGVDAFEDFVGAGMHLGGDLGGEVGPEGGAREEAGEDGVAAGGLEGGTAGEFGGDYAQALFEFGKVPALAAEDADAGFRLDYGVTLAGDGLDESGFSAAVGAEDGDVLAGGDGEGDVVEDGVAAASYVDVLEGEEGWHRLTRIDGACAMRKQERG